MELNKNISLLLEILNLYLNCYECYNFPSIEELAILRDKLYKNEVSHIEKNINEIRNRLNTMSKNINFVSREININEMYCNTKKYILNNKKFNYERPIAIFTAGQPGCGKTSLVLQTLNEHEDDFVVVDMDSCRGLCNKNFNFLINGSDNYIKETSQIAGKILEKLSKYIILNNYNFIFEGTFGKPSYTLDLVKKLSNKYKIILKVMIVCREESLLCLFERFFLTSQYISIGRFVSIEDHDKIYFNFIKNIISLENEDIEIEIYERGTEINSPHLVYANNNSNNLNVNIEEIINDIRDRDKERVFKNSNERIKNINNLVNNNYPKLKPELKILNEIFNYKHIE